MPYLMLELPTPHQLHLLLQELVINGITPLTMCCMNMSMMALAVIGLTYRAWAQVQGTLLLKV